MKSEMTEKERERYEVLKDYLAASKSDLNMMRRMVDGLLKETQNFHGMNSSPEPFRNIHDQAVRIRSLLNLRLVALEDLITILGEYGIKI